MAADCRAAVAGSEVPSEQFANSVEHEFSVIILREKELELLQKINANEIIKDSSRDIKFSFDGCYDMA